MSGDILKKVKVICGGAALTPRFVKEVCGADAHAKDAADGVKKIKEMLGASDSLKLVSMIALGYAQGEHPAHKKKSLGAVLHWEHF